MADNITITPGSGKTIAGDDVGGVLYQRIKIGLGGDGSAEDAVGGSGTISAGVQRVTIATDDSVATDLTATKTSLQIIDDWDESDRAKVNLIVGEAGISAGAGAVATNTPRVTLASDDPAVASLDNIESYTGTANVHLSSIASDITALLASDGTTSGYLSNMNTNLGVVAVNSNTIATDTTAISTNTGSIATSSSTIVTNTGNAAASLSVLDDWDESDRAKVNIIAGQAGITAGAGVVSAGTPRVTLASDDPAVTSLAIIDDWDESDRAKVNIIAGQAGITAGAGAVGVNTPRVTLASDDPAVTALGTSNTNTGNIATSLAIIDDWDESDRAKVNIIAGQAGITAGAGAVAVNTPRVTLASDDPAVTSLAIIDDWDESDRAKVNIIAGQAGITAGAGAVAVNTPRVTLASDDPAVTSLAIIDDWDESDRAKVNIIAGQAGITAGAGAVAVNTPRVTLASDDPAVTSLAAIDDWDESDRAKVNTIVGQAGVAGNTGLISAATQRITIATDDTVATDLTAIRTAVQIMDDWDETDRAKVNIIAGQAGITAGAGAVGASTPRVTLASDDPAVTSLAAIDDWDESDRAKVNIIVGQAGVAGGTGTVGATVQRVTIATDDAAITALQLIDNIVQVEDAAHSSGHSGVMALTVRSDTKASTAGTTGDYAGLTSNNIGDLHVDAGKFYNGGALFIGSSGGSYVANDCVGGKLSITNMARVSGGGGIVCSVTLGYRGTTVTTNPDDFELLLFRDDPSGSTLTDSAAISIVAADLDIYIGSVLFERVMTTGGTVTFVATNLQLPYHLVGTIMYGALVCRNTPSSLSTSGFVLMVNVVRD